FFFSSRRRHTRFSRDWSSDVCSSDLGLLGVSGNGADQVEVDTDVAGSCRPALLHRRVEDDVIIGGYRQPGVGGDFSFQLTRTPRSEERRVGEEGRAWGWAGAQDRTAH